MGRPRKIVDVKTDLVEVVEVEQEQESGAFVAVSDNAETQTGQSSKAGEVRIILLGQPLVFATRVVDGVTVADETVYTQVLLQGCKRAGLVLHIVKGQPVTSGVEVTF